jgi:hypothetical protein
MDLDFKPIRPTERISTFKQHRLRQTWLSIAMIVEVVRGLHIDQVLAERLF